MSWSTSQLATIAGTTVKTIRYYHQTGALPEPGRAANGYKQYEVRHLVALIRILRLKELGLAVAFDADPDATEQSLWETIRTLDAEIEARIATWTAVRTELAALLERSEEGEPAIDLPAGMLGLTDAANDADRAMLLVYSRVFDQETMVGIAERMRNHEKTEAEREFDALPDDAPEDVKRRLAEELAPIIAEDEVASGWGSESRSHLLHDPSTVAETLAEALAEYFNPAQLEVLHRANAINQEA